jgi:hypothetical protein
MTQQARTFRLFVSSTFSDLKAERNALQAYVFPRLRELCEQHGSRFQPIDLRWGVSTEASLDQQAMTICLEEIARCQQTSPRPNFIILLGDRYGWCPPPSHILDSEFQEILRMVKNQDDQALLSQWYQLDENAVPPEWLLKPRLKGSPYEIYDNWQPVEARLQAILAQAALGLGFSPARLLPYTASATEQEIAAGALMVKDAPEHVFCFFRSLEGLPMEFNAQAFRTLVRKRLSDSFPSGLSNTSQGLVNQILGNLAYSSASDFANAINLAINGISIESPEVDAVRFLQQVLVDFTGKEFQNLDDNWSFDEITNKKQRNLKARLISNIPNNVRTYSARWKADSISGDLISTEHINQLCEDVYNALSGIILEEIEHPHSNAVEKEIVYVQLSSSLDSEGLLHRKFAEEHLRVFVGREDILAKISSYLNQGGNHILAIIGAGGTGKSTLTAKAIQEAQKAHPNAEIVYRFVGVTPGSSDGRSLLNSLCHEICRDYRKDVTDIPTDYPNLVPELGKRMALAKAERPLILFLDSLDQLSESQGARSLVWLPSVLPTNVKVIVSTRPEEISTVLQAKQAQVEMLGGLTLEEGNCLLSVWLERSQRTLQPAQRKELLDKFAKSQGNPLYLRLAFEECRLWKSGQPAEVLAEGVSGIVEKNMIARLANEGNHGLMLVSRAFGYLAASRYGLAEDEMVDLLSRDHEVYTWFFNSSYQFPPDLVQQAISYLETCSTITNDQDKEVTAINWLWNIRKTPDRAREFFEDVLLKTNGPRLPVVLWSRLYFDLEPYLAERIQDGSTLMNFYHRELLDVAQRAFLSDKQDKLYHERIAAYLHLKADPECDDSWTGNYIHGLSELPHHLINAALGDELFKVLTNFRFLEHKSSQVGIREFADQDGNITKVYSGVYQLQEDFDRAIKEFPDDRNVRTGVQIEPGRINKIISQIFSRGNKS